jgi:hypothetical protein
MWRVDEPSQDWMCAADKASGKILSIAYPHLIALGLLVLVVDAIRSADATSCVLQVGMSSSSVSPSNPSAATEMLVGFLGV